MDDLTCAFCWQVVENPVIDASSSIAAKGCPHVFCDACFRKSSKSECPMCRTRFIPVLCEFIAKTVRNSTALCIYNPRGCSVSSAMCSIAKHEAQCEFRDTTCEECGGLVAANQMQEHLSWSECPNCKEMQAHCKKHKCTPCRYCGAFTASIRCHLAHDCKEATVFCPIPGCGTEVLRRNLDAHTSDAITHFRLLREHAVLTQRLWLQSCPVPSAKLYQVWDGGVPPP